MNLHKNNRYEFPENLWLASLNLIQNKKTSFEKEDFSEYNLKLFQINNFLDICDIHPIPDSIAKQHFKDFFVE